MEKRWLFVRRDANGVVSFGPVDWVVQALIVGNLVAFAIETMPDLSPKCQVFLAWFEAVSVAIFTLELVLRTVLSVPRGRYLLSFYGLADLMAIAPFYASLGLDLRSLRAVRLLRLFRMFKLVRYTQAIRRYQRAFVLVKEDLFVFGAMAAIVLYLASVGIYYFESAAQPEKFGSVVQCLWWSVATLTTVGYGDVFPVTAGGKVFTFVVLMLGLGVVAVPTGLFASALTQAREDAKQAARVDAADPVAKD